MDTNLPEQLRMLTIQRAQMEADDPSLMLKSNPDHAMLCSQIAAIADLLETQQHMEVANGDSH